MSVTYGFYDSLNGDRRYNSKQLSELFDGIIRDGVFMSVGDALIVSAAEGMNVNVGSGRAWFNHTWTNNDAPILLPIAQSEVVLDRIDTVVLEVNSNDDVRANAIKVIKGTPSSEPIPPVLLTTEWINQYPLCHIHVGAGVTEIVQANITNKVGTSECPFVSGILETVDVNALLLQWESAFDILLNAKDEEFDAWFQTLVDILDENTAANLLSLINNLAGPGRTTETVKGNADALSSHKADYEYQTPTIVGTQIRLAKQSDTNILKFQLDADLAGGAITISTDAGATSKPLLDIDGVAVTELSKGFVEVVEDVANFTYAPRGASLKYFDNISINKNTSSVGTIRSMSVDNDYIYATTSLSKLCKISKSTLDIINDVDIGTQYADDVNVDNDYIYFRFNNGASTLSKIMKYRKSDLTKVAESTSYATTIGTLKSDNSYLYFSKNDGSYWSLYKMNKSNLSIASQVTNIFQYSFYLTLDSSFIYVSGTTLRKYNISNLTLVTDLQSTLQGVLYNDSLNIYMRGTARDKYLTKYVKSTLVVDLQSKTALNYYSMGLDDDNIYIGFSTSTGILVIKKSDFSTIGTSEIQGATRCIDTDSLFVYASRGSNMLIKYDKPVVPYYSYKTLKLVLMND